MNSKINERKYWIERFSSNVTPTNIKLDYHRSDSYLEKNEVIEFTLDEQINEKLFELTNGDFLLIYSTLLANMNICLYKYTGNTTITIGSPSYISNNNGSAPDNALGIINYISEQLSFRQFLLNVHNGLLDTYENQNYPYNSLIRDLDMEQVKNKCPLFDVAMILKSIHNDIPEINNDISILFTEEQNQISGQLIYKSDLFKKETVNRFIKHFINVLQTALANTDILISDLQILTKEELHQQLIINNETQMDYPKDKCVHQLFEDQVKRNPEATALVYADERLTYRELNQRANQLAHYLISLGIKPDMMIGVFIDRALEMVIGLLGILKAGGAYVPLDPTYPKERLAAMLNDADGLKIILTKDHLLDKLPAHNAKVVCLDKDWEVVSKEDTENSDRQVKTSNLAYVIFTSGSTGRAKGAAVYHRGWTNLLNWFKVQFKITDQDKVLVISSFSFDITQRSIAMPLIVGGELHILASNHYDLELITKSIFHERISLLNCSPSTFYPLVENKNEDTFKKLVSLRCLFLGGEAISASRLQQWATSNFCTTEIINVYGAAECSDVSLFYRLTDFEQYTESSVPIGYLIFNNKVYILDKNLNPVPVGMDGEICLAGDCVGKGYINDAELTTQKFISNPFSNNPEDLLFRTGDLGRFMPDYNIEFIGRTDHQVKIRGFRIDLGDIETILRQHSEIQEAIVVKKEYPNKDERLVAYVVSDQNLECNPCSNSNNQKKLISRLKSFSKKRLPAYMVPNIFVVMNALPLSPNGKVDRKALPEPDTSMLISDEKEGNEHQLKTSVEKSVYNTFTEVLNLDQVGIHNNFFNELGGHSLVATQAISMLNEKYQIQLTPTDILLEPTVVGLAKRIEKNFR